MCNILQFLGFFLRLEDFVNFSVFEGTEKLLGCGLLRMGAVPRLKLQQPLAMLFLEFFGHFLTLKFTKFQAFYPYCMHALLLMKMSSYLFYFHANQFVCIYSLFLLICFILFYFHDFGKLIVFLFLIFFNSCLFNIYVNCLVIILYHESKFILCHVQFFAGLFVALVLSLGLLKQHEVG